MKLYELTYVTSPDLPEEEQKKLSERVISFLQIQPTQKQFSGFLTSLDFHSEPEKIKDIEEKLKAEQQIQKYMILKKRVPRPEAKVSKRILISKKTEKKAEKPKVELKEIEKKLDEILKE